jgi:hypothetical protein
VTALAGSGFVVMVRDWTVIPVHDIVCPVAWAGSLLYRTSDLRCPCARMPVLFLFSLFLFLLINLKIN